FACLGVATSAAGLLCAHYVGDYQAVRDKPPGDVFRLVVYCSVGGAIVGAFVAVLPLRRPGWRLPPLPTPPACGGGPVAPRTPRRWRQACCRASRFARPRRRRSSGSRAERRRSGRPTGG